MLNRTVVKKIAAIESMIRYVCMISCLLMPTFSYSEWHDPVLKEVLSNSLGQPGGFTDRFDQQVWLVDMSTRLAKFIQDPEARVELLKTVHQEATKVDLQPELVLAVIQTESSFNQYAVSSAGAQGLMQIMPFWKEVLGRKNDNLIKVRTNLRYGCTILSYYIAKENGNLTTALARYNGSLGQTWYPERVLMNWEKHWFVK